MNLTPTDRLESFLKEIDALRCDLARMTRNDDNRIAGNWHNEVVNVLKSLVARAENGEYQMNRTGKGA